MDSTVLKMLTGSLKCKLTNEIDLKKSNPTSFTATISGTEDVYSLFPGTVLFLGFYKGMGTITVAVSNHEIVRYLNLRDMQVWNYTSIQKGQYLGKVHSHLSLQFEYCTQWKGTSIYPVRINNNLYFKQNPIDILEGKYTPFKEINVRNDATKLSAKVVFTPDQLLEWGPTNIDNSDMYIEGAEITGGN